MSHARAGIGRHFVAGVAFVVLGSVAAGCVVFPTAANVTTTGQLSAPTRGIALAVVFSHDHAPETRRHLGKEMVDCIVKGVADAAPDVRVVSAEEFHRVVFGSSPERYCSARTRSCRSFHERR
jgi:hypothetical protein